MDKAEIEEVERLVNEQILRNSGVETRVLPLEQAVATGAMALFGEKSETKCAWFQSPISARSFAAARTPAALAISVSSKSSMRGVSRPGSAASSRYRAAQIVVSARRHCGFGSPPPSLRAVASEAAPKPESGSLRSKHHRKVEKTRRRYWQHGGSKRRPDIEERHVVLNSSLPCPQRFDQRCIPEHVKGAQLPAL